MAIGFIENNKGSISRRGLLAGAVAVAATAIGTTAASTAARRPPPPGRPRPVPRERPPRSGGSSPPPRSPTRRSRSSAGLAHRGGSRLPRRTGRGFVVDVRRHGAKPDGSADAAPAINRAIAAVGERGGGTVLIPEGTYRIDDIIRIGHSDVVVRGAGSGRTKLYATRNLTELIGTYGSRYGGDKSSWSWKPAASSGSARRIVGPRSPTRSGRRPGPSRAGPATGATSGAP